MKSEILYEDKDLLVCYKPAGFPVQTGNSLKPDLVSECRKYLYRHTGEKNPYLGLIHRLDQPVEGILVLAKHRKAAAELERRLSDGSVKKTYVAVLHGIIPVERAELVDYLKREKNGNGAIAKKGDPEAKEARLSYEVLAKREEKSLVRIHLQTGRFHQIRLQMAHMGHPILGDVRYGKEEHPGRGFVPLALCACQLDFFHPADQRPMHFAVLPRGAHFKDFHVDISDIIA